MNKHLPSNFWALDDRMTVVLFAGMGGGCDGLEAAGFHVHLAVNHDRIAVAVHEKRHPHTKHLRCDVFEVDPRKATNGRRVRVLHASPDCTHFSVAKGGKPVSKRRRSLAWVVPRWAGTVRPETITLENVPEIQTWGGLIAKRDKATGRVIKLDETVAAKGERVPVEQQWLVPDPKKRGIIWRDWLKHMRGLGYNYEGKVLVCADYGVPTIRKRYFGVAKADGSSIVWPARTHAPRDKAKALGLKPWVGAHTILDFSLPVKSIFGRKKDLAEATLRRTARGVMRYVVQHKRPFIVPITNAGSDRVNSVDEPLRTLTTAHRGELSVVMPHVAQYRTGATGKDVGEPLPTVTANSFRKRPGGAIPLGVVETTLSPFVEGVGGRSAQTDPRAVDVPMGSTTTKEDRVLVGATLQAYYGGEQGLRRNGDVEEPLQTFVTEPRHAMVAAFLEKFTENAAGSMPDEPLHTVMAGAPRHALVTAFMAQHNNDSRRDGGVNPGREAMEPLSTVTASGSQQGVIAASMLALRGTNKAGRDAKAPVATITANGLHAGIVAASLNEMRGASIEGREAVDPLSTQTATPHSQLVLAFLQAYYSGNGGYEQSVTDPLGALTQKARHGLVIVKIGKTEFYISDIGIRMLEPEEGAMAHGFERDCLSMEITVYNERKKRMETRKLTKTEKYHLVGNSVPPLPITLLAQLNVERELMVAAE